MQTSQINFRKKLEFFEKWAVLHQCFGLEVFEDLYTKGLLWQSTDGAPLLGSSGRSMQDDVSTLVWDTHVQVHMLDVGGPDVYPNLHTCCEHVLLVFPLAR